MFLYPLCIVTISNLLYLYWHLASHILHHQLFLFFTTAKNRKVRVFSKITSGANLMGRERTWASFANAASGVMSSPGIAPAFINTSRKELSPNSVIFWELLKSFWKVFNYLASFIEGGNPSVTTLSHTKDNHSPEHFFYQLCRLWKMF